VRTVLTGGAVLIDGAFQRRDVVVRDNLIEVVGEHATLAEDAQTQTLNAVGLFVMPGLHMCHFHPDFGCLDYDEREVIGAKYAPGVQTLIGARACEMLLSSGVTGIAGAGCSNNIDAALVEASRLGVKVLPRIYPSSTMIGTTGQAELDLVNWWEDRGNLGTYVIADGPDAMRKQVRDHIRHGAKIIKILYSGGRPMGPTRDEQRYMSLDELHAVVAAAHERGCKVRAHVAYRDRIRECVEAGVDLIDHGDEIDTDIVALMAERGTFWVPSTVFLHYLVASHRRRGRLTEADVRKERTLAAMGEMVALADQSGVPVLAGDDYGFAFLDHAPGVYGRELTMWVRDYGFSPEQVLRWATRNGAALHGLDDRLGAVREGALADLVVLRADPLADISIFETPAEHLAAVMVDGRFYKNELTATSNLVAATSR
jgi:imidazolonepropionase-like amidohydrolase